MEQRRYSGNDVARLHAAAEGLLGELDLEKLLTRVVTAGSGLLRCRLAVLSVVDGHGRIERVIRAGDEGVEPAGPAPSGAAAIGHRVATDAPGLVGGTQLHRDIRAGGEIHGVLSFIGPTAGRFTAEDLDVADAFAATAGIAWQNAVRHGQALRDARAATALNMLITPMISADDDEIFGVAARSAASIVPATFVSIVCPEGDGGLIVRGAVGRHANELLGVVYESEGTLAGRALASGLVAVAVGPHEFPTSSGALRLGHVAAIPLMDRGRALGVIHLGRDLRGPLFSHAELDSVTSFAAAAAEVIGRVRERASWRAVDTAVAEERSRIARDLHDTVIQRLFVTGLGLQAIGSANPLVDDAIEVQTNQIDAAIGDLRAAVSELATGVASGAPRDVRDSVVQELADLAASAGTAPRVVFAVPPNRALPPAIIDDILAVVREGAANILRHARSRWSEVTIEVDDAAATVVLEDDGVGIRANARRSGISNLEERALRHGGTFEVRRREGGGTRVRWRVPLGSAPA